MTEKAKLKQLKRFKEFEVTKTITKAQVGRIPEIKTTTKVLRDSKENNIQKTLILSVALTVVEGRKF